MAFEIINQIETKTNGRLFNEDAGEVREHNGRFSQGVWSLKHVLVKETTSRETPTMVEMKPAIWKDTLTVRTFSASLKGCRIVTSLVDCLSRSSGITVQLFTLKPSSAASLPSTTWNFAPVFSGW